MKIPLPYQGTCELLIIMLFYSVESYPLLTAISSMRPKYFNDTNVESLTEISAVLFYTVDQVLLDRNRTHTNLIIAIATLSSVIGEEYSDSWADLGGGEGFRGLQAIINFIFLISICSFTSG